MESPTQRPASIIEDVKVPVRGFARVMVKTMTAANAVPHFGYCDEVQMDGLMTLRCVWLGFECENVHSHDCAALAQSPWLLIEA